MYSPNSMILSGLLKRRAILCEALATQQEHGWVGILLSLLILLNNYYLPYYLPSSSFEAQVMQHHHTLLPTFESLFHILQTFLCTPSLTFVPENFDIHKDGPDWTVCSLTSSPPMPFTTPLLVTTLCGQTSATTPHPKTGLVHSWTTSSCISAFSFPFFFPMLTSLS